MLFKEVGCLKSEKISVRQVDSQSVSQPFCQSGESEPLFPVEPCTRPVLSVPVGPLGDSFSLAGEENAVEMVYRLK